MNTPVQPQAAPDTATQAQAQPQRIVATSKLHQILALAQRGADMADIAKITALPEELIQLTLDNTPLPPELKDLAAECSTFADLYTALKVAKHKRLLAHEDRASDIYSTLLKRTEESLQQAGTVQLRTLLEGIRILQPSVTAASTTRAAATQIASVQNNHTTVQISLSGLSRTTRPVLDDSGNVIGTASEDGKVTPLVGMSTNGLRHLGGTSAATAQATKSPSLRQLLQQSLNGLEPGLNTALPADDVIENIHTTESSSG